MSVYNRKGGSGKSGSLREQFNYYKRQLDRRLIEEQAFKEARGAGTIEGRIQTLFNEENLNYYKVFNEGITRKKGAKTVRYVGEEAVKIQIGSLKKRASKSYQAERFIENVENAMSIKGFTLSQINRADRLLRSASVDKLTLLIQKGLVKTPPYIYALDTYEDYLDELENALKYGVTSEELKEFRTKKKALVEVIKRRNKILN